MSNWKKIAGVVAVVVVIGAITTWALANWTTVVDEALCTIQSNIGLNTHAHISDSFSCPND